MATRHKVLVVDDERALLFVLRTSLSRSGAEYVIDVASRGREALDRVRSTSYDLLLTDLRMPGMDGIQLTKAIRDIDSHIAVVWMTAHGCYEVMTKAAELGVYCCLEKPVKIGDIRRVVREALQSLGD